MQITDPYNESVREYFLHPAHTGDLQDEHACAYLADVRESANGARLIIALGVDENTIEEIRFRAVACPHLIAAAEYLCRHCQRKEVGALRTWDRNELMQRLSIPVEKTGRILLLEDALSSLAKQHENAVLADSPSTTGAEISERL